MGASAFSAFPRAHFPPWGGMGPLPSDALPSSPLDFLCVLGRFTVCTLVFARSQEILFHHVSNTGVNEVVIIHSKIDALLSPCDREETEAQSSLVTFQVILLMGNLNPGGTTIEHLGHFSVALCSFYLTWKLKKHPFREL